MADYEELGPGSGGTVDAPPPPPPPLVTSDARPLGADDDVNLDSDHKKVTDKTGADDEAAVVKSKKKKTPSEEKPKKSKSEEKKTKKKKSKKEKKEDKKLSRKAESRLTVLIGVAGAIVVISLVLFIFVLLHIVGAVKMVPALV